MASAYSDDLRRKFFEAYQRGDGSLAVLARRFSVSLGWAEKLMRTVRQTGRTERPAGNKRGPASKLTPELRETVRGWIQAQPDLTLAEMRQRLWKQQGVEVSLSRLWTVLGEMGLRLKKSHFTPPSRIPPQPASSAASGGRKRARSTRRS
jgi:transposase